MCIRDRHISQLLLSTKGLDFVLRNLSLILEVSLISYQKINSIFLCIGLNLFHPEVADVLKTQLICQIKYQQNALTSSVICTGNSSESLLTGSIPNLELDVFVVDLDSFEAEVHSNSGQVVLRELVLDETHQNG